MSATLANWLVGIGAAYLGLGLVFAVPFVLRGAAAIDPDARGASVGFRLAILPGCAVFWPLLLRRWISGEPPRERSPHRLGETP